MTTHRVRLFIDIETENGGFIVREIDLPFVPASGMLLCLNDLTAEAWWNQLYVDHVVWLHESQKFDVDCRTNGPSINDERLDFMMKHGWESL